LFPH